MGKTVYDIAATQEKVISIEPITIDAVQVVYKETTVEVPRVVFIDTSVERPVFTDVSYERPILIDKEYERPILVSKEYERPVIKMVPAEIPDLAETVAWLKKEMMEVVELKEKLNDLISDSREEITKILEEIKNSIPDSIPMPVINEISYEVKVPKFVEYEVKSCKIIEQTVDVIKPNFVVKDYDVVGSIKVRS